MSVRIAFDAAHPAPRGAHDYRPLSANGASSITKTVERKHIQDPKQVTETFLTDESFQTAVWGDEGIKRSFKVGLAITTQNGETIYAPNITKQQFDAAVKFTEKSGGDFTDLTPIQKQNREASSLPTKKIPQSVCTVAVYSISAPN